MMSKAETGNHAIEIDVSDAYAQQERFGNDPKIVVGKHINIVHKAKFETLTCACDSCDGTKARKYFYILENGIESNYPAGCDLCCFVIPPNWLCAGKDLIHKYYFDRGIFDRQNCCFATGIFAGPPELYANERTYVCCCIDCCECFSRYQECYWKNVCGERVRYLPCQTVCFCCPTKSCWYYNCCSLSGIKNGDPVCLFPFATHLKVGTPETGDIGEGAKISAQLNTARDSWKAKHGITD